MDKQLISELSISFFNALEKWLNEGTNHQFVYSKNSQGNIGRYEAFSDADKKYEVDSYCGQIRLLLVKYQSLRKHATALGNAEILQPLDDLENVIKNLPAQLSIYWRPDLSIEQKNAALSFLVTEAPEKINFVKQLLEEKLKSHKKG